MEHGSLCGANWTYYGLDPILGLFLQKAAAAVDTKLGFALYVCT